MISESEPFDPNRFVRQIDPNLQLEAQNMIQMQKQIEDLKAENVRLVAENADLQRILNSGATPAEPGSLFDEARRRSLDTQREDDTPPGMNGSSMSYLSQDFRNPGPPPPSD